MHGRVLQNIYDTHDAILGDELVAIVGCGSIRNDLHDAHDVDFVVVVQELTPSVVGGLSKARDTLIAILPVEPSSTVITSDDVTFLPDRFLLLDGKAVQALIEAGTDMVCSKKDLHIPALTQDRMLDFSRQNAAYLRSLLTKHLIRSSQAIHMDDRVKMAKIGLIICKMLAQASMLHDADSSGLRSKLMHLKKSPEQFSPHEVRELIVAVLLS